MKRLIFAAALLACTTVPFAQMYMPPPTQPQGDAPKQRTDSAQAPAATAPQVNIPAPNCEPKPAYPGGAAMRAMDNKRRQFERDIENYKKCMLAYMEERKAMHEANQVLHKAAIEEYNATMKSINESLQANR